MDWRESWVSSTIPKFGNPKWNVWIMWTSQLNDRIIGFFVVPSVGPWKGWRHILNTWKARFLGGVANTGLGEAEEIRQIMPDQTFASCAEVVEAVGKGRAVAVLCWSKAFDTVSHKLFTQENMELNKSHCGLLNPGWNNPTYQHRLEFVWLREGSTSAEMDLEVLVATRHGSTAEASMNVLVRYIYVFALGRGSVCFNGLVGWN